MNTQFRATLRGLFQRQSLGFMVVVTLCLAVGIGAGITVFSVANAVLIRPLPGVSRPESLVSLTTKPMTIPGLPGMVSLGLPYPLFQRYQKDSGVFSELATYQDASFNVGIGAHTERIAGQFVSENYFSTLGMYPQQGRFFEEGEHRRISEPVLVVSDRLWQRFFFDSNDASDPGTLRINGRSFDVIGVAAQGFHGTIRYKMVDIWVPMELAPLVDPSITQANLLDSSRNWLFRFFGRLNPGVDLDKAQARLDTLGQQVAEEAADDETPELQIHPYIGTLPDDRQDLIRPLRYLGMAVALLTLVVCTNSGGLLLVRLLGRRAEIGVRLALGARRSAIVGQVWMEALLLSVLGIVFGLLLASGLTHFLEGVTLGKYLPDLHHLDLDWRVLTFTVGMALLMAVGFGLVPGIWVSRPGVCGLTSQSARAGSRLWFQEILAVVQTAAAVVLIICTGLFVRTLQNLESVDPGFNPEKVLNLRIDLEVLDYGQAAGMALYEQLLENVRGLPGVESTALAYEVPFDRDNRRGLITSVGHEGSTPEERSWLRFNSVSPGYFRTLGISLAQGEDFSARDRSDALQVMIINQSMALKMFSADNPVGRHLLVGDIPRKVIGVVGDIHVADMTSKPQPRFYLPVRQHYVPQATFHLRCSLDPASVVQPAIRELQKLDRNAVFETKYFDEELRHAMAGPRLLSSLFGGFGLVALLIAATGLYTVLVYAVRRRNRELGVRMALGAESHHIVNLVTRHALLLTLIGVTCGLGAALAATKTLTSVLYGVDPNDPMIFATVAVIGLLVGLAAAVIPAVGAARVDPVIALRCE